MTEPGNLRELMIIDGAINCSFDIYTITQEQFEFIFPAKGQQLECIEALIKNRGEDTVKKAFEGLWDHLVLNKDQAEGIHGTLFYQYPTRRALYPSLRWRETDTPSDFDEQAPLGTDRNIMIDDGTHECRYDMFRITHEQFLLLFPDRAMHQEFEFSEDLADRMGGDEAAQLLAEIKKRRYRDKANVMGLDGVVYENRRKVVKKSFDHKNYYRNNWKRYRWDEEDDKNWGSPRG